MVSAVGDGSSWPAVLAWSKKPGSPVFLPRLPESRCLLQPPAHPLRQPALGLQGPLECDKGPLLLLSLNSVCVLTPSTGSCLSPCHGIGLSQFQMTLVPLQGWKGRRPVWVAAGMRTQGLRCLSKARVASGHSRWPWSDRWPPYCMTSESKLTRTLAGGS